MGSPKALVFALVLVGLFSPFCFATPVPANGNYDIDNISAEALLFNPDPWVSPSFAMTAFVTVYATNDYANIYAGASNVCNLGTVAFINGGKNIYDGGAVSGDLAIRFGNSTTSDITFSSTVMTINFMSEPMNVYLPEFTLEKSQSMHFWVADDGSSYYANITSGEGSSGAPNMSASESIDGGYVAAVPEPGTLAILGFGGFFLLRRKVK